MFAKFALFVLLACAAVQAYPQQNTKINERDFQEIWDKIKQIVEEIKKELGDLGGNIANIIQQIKDKISSIVGDLDLQGIINKIEDWIKGKFGSVSEKVQQCIDAQNDAINKIANEVKDASMECASKAEDTVLTLEDDLKKLGSQVLGIVEGLLGDAGKCLISGNIQECLNGVWTDAQAEYENVKKAMSGLMTRAEEVATEALNQLEVCMAGVAKDTAAKEAAILVKIEKCVVSKNAIRAY